VAPVLRDVGGQIEGLQVIVGTSRRSSSGEFSTVAI
jgi:hypothetical protein